jgi:hypothetical protein
VLARWNPIFDQVWGHLSKINDVSSSAPVGVENL